MSVQTVRRIAAESDITTVDNAAERARRQVGRPSKAEVYHDVLVAALTEEPTLEPLLLRIEEPDVFRSCTMFYGHHVKSMLKMRPAVTAAMVGSRCRREGR